MSAIETLRKTVKKLRAPDGCAWDREQTHQSLIPCLIEECFEVIEAIEDQDDPLLEEELGDLLLSILMHAEIASETGRFDLDDVARSINEKLIRRHPHVFGPDAGKMDTASILLQWERIKAAEKEAKGIRTSTLFKELPPALPALYGATAVAKVFRKQALAPTPSFDRQNLPSMTKTEVARNLFHLSALCDQEGWDPETLLRQHTRQIRKEAEGHSG